MKIMHVIHGLNTGGAETLVKEYVTYSDKTVFDVVVLCMEHYYESPYEKTLKNKGIKVIYICDYMKYYDKKNFIYKCINYIQKYLLIKHFIKKEDPDILHTHLLINKYIKFARPKKNKKIFHTMHGEPERYKKLDKMDFKAIKWLIKNNNMKIICLHEEMRKEVNKIFQIDNSIVLNNGIDFDRFCNAKSRDTTRNDLNISKEAFVLGHIGRFSKVKNHEFLIKVFNEIYKKNEKAYLLMVGDGEEKDNIINFLQEYNLNNNYMILSNREDIPDLLNAMDVFIFPSVSEGLGISLIEAQEAKLPCVISDRIPNHAIISNLITKMSLEDSIENWANSILNAKRTNPIYLNDKDWDIKDVVKKLEQIYLEND